MYWIGRGRWRRGLAALAFVFVAGCSKPRNQNLLEQHRNLGKAFYENPTTQQDAVREFQQALAIDPDSARDKLNYALALLKVQGREAGSNQAFARSAASGSFAAAHLVQSWDLLQAPGRHEASHRAIRGHAGRERRTRRLRTINWARYTTK